MLRNTCEIHWQKVAFAQMSSSSGRREQDPRKSHKIFKKATTRNAVKMIPAEDVDADIVCPYISTLVVFA